MILTGLNNVSQTTLFVQNGQVKIESGPKVYI